MKSINLRHSKCQIFLNLLVKLLPLTLFSLDFLWHLHIASSQKLLVTQQQKNIKMFLLHLIILWSHHHNTRSTKSKWFPCSRPMNTLTSQALLFPAEQRDPATTRTIRFEMSLFSSRVQSLGASPISYHSLLHLSVGCAKVRDLSCHHWDTCGKAAPSWQIGFPWTASLTQDFPSLLCPFQIFCYNNENGSKNRDLLPLRGASWHDLLQMCFNAPHSETEHGSVMADLNC